MTEVEKTGLWRLLTAFSLFMCIVLLIGFKQKESEIDSLQVRVKWLEIGEKRRDSEIEYEVNSIRSAIGSLKRNTEQKISRIESRLKESKCDK